ncbi:MULTISPECIES: hypothetical protein [unclassified Streptomyces]
MAEVSADQVVDRGVFRHPLRFQGIRLDMTAAEAPPFGAGPTAAAG